MIATSLTLPWPVVAACLLNFALGIAAGWMWRGDHEYHNRQAERRRRRDWERRRAAIVQTQDSRRPR